MERPSDETLMSYVDGVATAEERARVERAVAEDPAVGERIDAMRRSGELLSEAFDQPMREAPPQHLVDMILSAPAGAANEIVSPRFRPGTQRALEDQSCSGARGVDRHAGRGGCWFPGRQLGAVCGAIAIPRAWGRAA